MVFLLLLISCNTKESSTPVGSTDNDDLTTIKIIAESPGAVQFIQMQEKEIAEKYGIRLEYNYPERLTENLEDFLFATEEQYDIYSIFPVKLPLYVEREMLFPLDEYITEEFESDLLPFYRKLYMNYGGHDYGMAYDGDAHLLFYRKDLFEKYNDEYKQLYGVDLKPPTTWQEYDQVASFLTRDLDSDGKIDIYGTAIVNGGGMSYPWFIERFMSMGGTFFDKNMKPTLNSEIGQKVLQDLVNLQNSNAVPPGSMYDWEDLNNAFLQGKIAMCVQWSDTARFSYDSDTWKSKVAHKVDWTIVPGELPEAPRGGSFIGRVLAISSDSKVPDKAWQVIEHLTSKEVSIKSINSYQTINDPFRYSHFEVDGKGPFPTELVSHDFFETLSESLKNTNAELMIPGSWDYMQSLDRNMGLALINKLTPEQALEQTEREWEAITNKYGRDTQKQYYHEWVRKLEEVRELNEK